MVHIDHHGPLGSPGPNLAPVVLLHGFTQSGASWHSLVAALLGSDPARAAVTVDLPGHGRSGAVVADLWETAALVADAAGPGHYVGYSMGARVALHIALCRPTIVRRLVLVSGTAGIDLPEQRRRRLEDDEEIARRIERDGVDEFLTWWLRRPIFSTLPSSGADLQSRSGHTAAGLAASLRSSGTGTQDPLEDRLGAIEVPTLVVVGGLDKAFLRRGKRMVDAIGSNARLVIVTDAGHAVPFEQPQRFESAVIDFLGEETLAPATREKG